MFGKLRPQIFLAIVVLGILSSIGVVYEYNEIATGCSSWHESSGERINGRHGILFLHRSWGVFL